MAEQTVFPTPARTVEKLLAGSREGYWTWELLTHDPTTGRDRLAGYLAGVTTGNLHQAYNQPVRVSGQISVDDLPVDPPGQIAFRNANAGTALTRLRPVYHIKGVPGFNGADLAMPQSVHLFTAHPETHDDTGTTITVDLLDKTTVLQQDAITSVYTADTTTPVLQIIAAIITSAGEHIDVDTADLTRLANPKIWPVATSKLAIINDLCDIIGYQHLQTTPAGDFIVTPQIAPTARPRRFDTIDLAKVLSDAATTMYLTGWTRDLDNWNVPNRVICPENDQPTDDGNDPLVGLAENHDPTSPYSIEKQGRAVTETLSPQDMPDGLSPVERQTRLDTAATQSLTAYSARASTIELSCLPMPWWNSDVLQFSNQSADVDGLYQISLIDFDAAENGLMKLTMQEVLT